MVVPAQQPQVTAAPPPHTSCEGAQAAERAAVLPEQESLKGRFLICRRHVTDSGRKLMHGGDGRFSA